MGMDRGGPRSSVVSCVAFNLLLGGLALLAFLAIPMAKRKTAGAADDDHVEPREHISDPQPGPDGKLDDDHRADVESMDSFPASDPPARY